VNNWAQESDKTWIHGIGSIYDPFDPSLIHDALAESGGFRSVVFGWDTIDESAPCNNPISQLFTGVNGEFNHEL